MTFGVAKNYCVRSAISYDPLQAFSCLGQSLPVGDNPFQELLDPFTLEGYSLIDLGLPTGFSAAKIQGILEKLLSLIGPGEI